MLALARVLAVPPKLLVVDELSLGLAPRVVDDVYRALREIRDAGTSLLVIEQQLPRALELAEQLVVLRKGKVVEAGPVDKLSDLARELLPGSRATALERSAARRHGPGVRELEQGADRRLAHEPTPVLVESQAGGAVKDHGLGRAEDVVDHLGARARQELVLAGGTRARRRCSARWRRRHSSRARS